MDKFSHPLLFRERPLPVQEILKSLLTVFTHVHRITCLKILPSRRYKEGDFIAYYPMLKNSNITQEFKSLNHRNINIKLLLCLSCCLSTSSLSCVNYSEMCRLFVKMKGLALIVTSQDVCYHNKGVDCSCHISGSLRRYC